jgi:hypothetical protein
MMRFKVSYWFLIVLIVLMTLAIVEAATWQYTEAKIIPLLVSGVILVMGIIQLSKELNADRKAAAAGTEIQGPSLSHRQSMRNVSLALCWIVALFVAVYLFGFFVAIPIFIFGYLKTHGQGWLGSIIYAATVTAFVYGVFPLVLKLPFYDGWFFSL